jgi:glycosyltransferase involved in cell wall biosynthesis
VWLHRLADQMPVLPAYVSAVPCVTPRGHFKSENGILLKGINLLDSAVRVMRLLTEDGALHVWVCGLMPSVLTWAYLVAHPKSRCVYDAVEYVLGEHNTGAGKNPKSIRQRLVTLGILGIEEWLSRRAVAVIHTNRWRRRLFEHSHPVARLKSYIVENLHYSHMDTRTIVSPSLSTTIGYVGGLTGDRGLVLLLESLSLLPDSYTVTIVGKGTAEQRAVILRHAEDFGVSARLTLIPAVPYWDLQTLCQTFTCGVLLIDDELLNNRYCSPSKVFDYIAAQCPVVVSGVPPLRALAQLLGVGIAVSKPTNSIAVAAAIRAVVEKRASFRARCATAAPLLDWHTQTGVIDTVVRLLCS